jgi:hypothetical protein
MEIGIRRGSMGRRLDEWLEILYYHVLIEGNCQVCLIRYQFKESSSFRSVYPP